ncbi:DUF1765-domain-containing protein [Choiromyces venosus 120613-1]|uniref:DUF1765-domain-containing protein n=1 Tax=Choiromyces venosus 120613-1 TaxID=1336337 RepID=A0A3N4JGL6_9PEZI|nr:DUF1765-domain-containing protein [Choiromyces venosus 120613-1]
MPAATARTNGGGLNTAVEEAATPQARVQRSFSFRRPFNQAPRLSIPKAEDSSPLAASSAATTSISKTKATQQLKLGSPPRLSLASTSQSGNLLPALNDDDFFSDPLKPNTFISQKTITSITQDSNGQTGDASKTLMKPSLAPSATFEYDISLGGSGTKEQPQIKISTFLKPSDPMEDTSYQRPVSSASNASFLDLKTRSASETFVSLARRSWNSPSVSRSPSPSSRDENDSRSASSVSSSTSPTKANGAEDSVESKNESQPARPGITQSPSLLGKARRPLSMFMKSSASEPSLPSASTLKKAYVGSTDSVGSLGERPTLKKVKDELWEAYRLLENDFQRFQSKSTVQKANIVRESLIPFLRKFENKSTAHLAPDELDRRVRVLHRWWTGLMAQLRIRNSQAIAGADRPVYLEGISGIFSRPEWRSAPSTFAPVNQRLPASAKSWSSSSLASTSSAYSLQKSVQHNIKVLLTRTLYDTLGFTVEKMGLRTSPPSMVTFGGKVLAYAFYFCPGVADMLISLWEIQPATVRRVLPEFGVGRGTDLRQVSEAIVSDFPETLQSLGFTTLVATLRGMKQPAKPPIGIQVDWHGPWTSRWSGRDSDLLYVFLKYYHILMYDYLPADVSPLARFTVPGYVMVQAHMLSLLDNTIHRQPMPMGADSLASTTFEDMLANATAALPMAARNPARTMAENKMVILLRDVISDKVNYSEECRIMYITSFMAMIKGAVRKTRVYDAEACFTLCDLMEEILPIFSQAEKLYNTTFVDWPFWIDVLKQMLESENNMTELRLISFVYTAWDVIVEEEEERKRTICLEWLLSEAVWEKYFCHWCPMVRAYFMRLSCWRLGRYDGSPNPLDLDILETLLRRLRTAYAHYLRLKDKAEANKTPLPSTAPCLPQPCRRLLIIRSDVLTTPQGVLLDGIIPIAAPTSDTDSLPRPTSSMSLTSVSTATSDAQSILSADIVDTARSTDTNASSFSRRWGAIRSVIGFRSAANNDTFPPDSPELPVPRKRATGVSSSKGSPKRETSPTLQQPTRQQKNTTFKFALDWVDRPPFGNRERRLGPARIPSAGQKYVDAECDVPLSLDLSGYTGNASHWTYAGRALAEWVVVVMEHENFFERRKNEGKETNKDIETPSLVVDSARKF